MRKNWFSKKKFEKISRKYINAFYRRTGGVAISPIHGPTARDKNTCVEYSPGAFSNILNNYGMIVSPEIITSLMQMS